MGPEGTLKFKCDQRLREWSHKGWPLWWFKVHGGPYQRVGVPDYVLCIAGQFAAVELKAPGEVPTAKQDAEIVAIRKAYGSVEVCWSVEEFVAFVTKLVRRAD